MEINKSQLYFCIVIILLLLTGCIPISPIDELISNQTEIEPKKVERIETIHSSSNNNISFAAWNLQIYGEKKATTPGTIDTILDTVQTYDIVFFQEIRDSSGSAWNMLCDQAKEKGYQCILSSRSGRSQSKEQYGIIYKNIEFVKSYDYNPDSINRWERPPYRTEFRKNDVVYTFFVLHAKPDDVLNEITYLKQISDTIDTVVFVVGDLNMDCNYYDEDTELFGSYHSIITNAMDTTTSNTNCTYDRIFFKNNQSSVSGGVLNGNTNISDHYLVYATIK